MRGGNRGAEQGRKSEDEDFMFAGLDGGEFEDGALARFDARLVGEIAGGLDGFVPEGFESVGVGGFHFDGADLCAVEHEDGIEFDSPASGFPTDGSDFGEHAHDREFLGFGGKRNQNTQKK